MKRSAVSLEDVAAWDNLSRAFGRAARAARRREEALAFAENLEAELCRLREGIFEGTRPLGRFNSFRICDPKPREIHAPCFADRVLHHALVAVIGPVLDRALVADTFACREGKGALAAVRRAQHHARRFRWCVKVDVRSFFPSVDHQVLLAQLERRFKSPALLQLCRRIVSGHTAGAPLEQGRPRGLPIGSLTSQHFANHYLAPFDRLLLERLRVQAMVRYMDDVVWWCDERAQARATLTAARQFAGESLRLELKPQARIARSRDALALCGFVVRPGSVRLSLRRRRRYSGLRRQAEKAHARGLLTPAQLQQAYSVALAITAHADAKAFRREQLRRHPWACEPELGDVESEPAAASSGANRA